jgi:hypothetical protein
MSDKKETVFFRDKEFLAENWHYSPGWYWYDEEGSLYGPFTSKEHGERGLRLYLKQLEQGISPTQKPELYEEDFD